MHFLNNTHYTKFIFFCIRDCTFCFLGFVLSNVVFKPYRTHSHFLIVKCCGSYTKISCVICKRIKYLTVCNTPCHHNIRCSMCLREHVLDSLAWPYIPVRYTMVNHILLPLRPFFTFAGCNLTLSDHFHYLKWFLWIKSLLDKIYHNIVSCTYSCWNSSFSFFNKSLCIAKPYISTMRKSCDTDKVWEILWLSIHKHLHSKVSTKLWYSKCS